MDDKKLEVVWTDPKSVGAMVKFYPTPENKERFIFKYIRPPGTRGIIFDKQGRVLISKEFRHESGKWDMRLPGGKVFDTFDSWIKALDSGTDINQAAVEGMRKELRQEVGIEAGNLEPVDIAICGATIEWDLHYFVCKPGDYKVLDKQELEEHEQITFSWYSISEILEMFRKKEFGERGSIEVLLWYLQSVGKIKIETV